MTTTTTDLQAVVDAATRAATPQEILAGRLFSVATTDGQVHVIDVEDHLDRHRECPRRKTGQFRVHDAASFLAYLDKHGLPETEIWADVTRQQLVGVINAHLGVEDPAGNPAGWADHRVSLELRTTPAWNAWLKHNNQLAEQSGLAEHLEDRIVDVVRPTGADMLELAQTFHATIGVTFESSRQLSSGERQLEYKEEVNATAGKRGRLEIPKDFELGLVPFEGADRYKVTARLRYRISDGHLRIGYVLDRPEDVLRSAFSDIVDKVAEVAAPPVFFGVSA